MASRAEAIRKEIIRSKSPLNGHSLNQKNMKLESEGDVRAHGMSFSHRQRESRRMEERQLIYDSLNRLFAENATESDIVTVMSCLGDLEQREEFVNSDHPDTFYQISIVDFTGFKPTESKIGEPEFFRKK